MSLIYFAIALAFCVWSILFFGEGGGRQLGEPTSAFGEGVVIVPLAPLEPSLSECIFM